MVHSGMVVLFGEARDIVGWPPVKLRVLYILGTLSVPPCSEMPLFFMLEIRWVGPGQNDRFICRFIQTERSAFRLKDFDYIPEGALRHCR